MPLPRCRSAGRRTPTLLLLAAAIAGCGGPGRRAAAPPGKTAEPSDAPERPSGPIGGRGPHGAAPGPAPPDHDARYTAQLQEVDWPALAAAQPPQESWPPPVSRARFLLLAPAGPLIFEVHMTIDGRPFDQAMDELVEEALREADTDGDGTPTWDELVGHPRFRSGQFGNLAVEDGQEDSFVRMYDRDADQVVDRDELPRLLTRNAGGSRVFSVRGANYYLDNNRIDSPLRRLIDASHDGRIDAGEAERAAGRMRSRDVNEDDILVAGELEADSDSQRPGVLEVRLPSNPDAVAPLEEGRPWSRLLYALQERYEGGAPLAPDSFRMPRGLFAQLDADGDQRISREEISRLLELPPHLTLKLRFGADERPALGELSWAPALKMLGPAVSRHPGRLCLTLPHLKLEVFVNDIPSSNYQQLAQQQLAQLDTDGNGYLELDELDEGQPLRDQFPLLDADQDEKLYPAELEASLRRQQAAYASQVRCRAGFQPDALFSALDADHDGRLTSREIDRAADRIAHLDRDGDGELFVDEIPESMVVGFVRGDPQQDQTQFQPPRDVTPADVQAPRWFQHMDRNGDGEISSREFLGSRQQMERLDINRDGYLTVREATVESAAAP